MYISTLVYKQKPHKLIKWEFVIHEGIDDYSRKIVYLWCDTKNKSETVMSLFESAVEKHLACTCCVTSSGKQTDLGHVLKVSW